MGCAANLGIFLVVLLAILASELSRPPRRTLLLLEAPEGEAALAAFGRGIAALPAALRDNLCAPPFRRRGQAEKAMPGGAWNVALVFRGGLSAWSRNPHYVLEEAFEGSPFKGFSYAEFDATAGCGTTAAHLAAWRWRLAGSDLYTAGDSATLEVFHTGRAGGSVPYADACGARWWSMLLPRPAPLLLAGEVAESNAGLTYVAVSLGANGAGSEGGIAQAPPVAPPGTGQAWRAHLQMLPT